MFKKSKINRTKTCHKTAEEGGGIALGKLWKLVGVEVGIIYRN